MGPERVGVSQVPAVPVASRQWVAPGQPVVGGELGVAEGAWFVKRIGYFGRLRPLVVPASDGEVAAAGVGAELDAAPDAVVDASAAAAAAAVQGRGLVVEPWSAGSAAVAADSDAADYCSDSTQRSAYPVYSTVQQ